jgi:hypothetical protein
LKNPDNAEGWRLLGVTHAENDDDQQVIVPLSLIFDAVMFSDIPMPSMRIYVWHYHCTDYLIVALNHGCIGCVCLLKTEF